eukprot:scaffold83468_cov53-Attheya_sp.AAC.4
MFVENLLPAEQAMVGTLNVNTHYSVMGMEEVVQMNCFLDIDITVDVIGHAFVFHVDSIQDARHPVNGISDAFATKFHLNKISYDVPGDVTSFFDIDHKPFSNSCHSSSGEILYDGLMLVVSLMRDILYTKRQFQPFRNSKKTVLPRAVWEHICHKLVNVINCSTKERPRVRRQYFQNLALNKMHETHQILSLKDYKYTMTANNDSGNVFNGLLDHPNGNEITMTYDQIMKLYTLTVTFAELWFVEPVTNPKL